MGKRNYPLKFQSEARNQFLVRQKSQVYNKVVSLENDLSIKLSYIISRDEPYYLESNVMRQGVMLLCCLRA
jgi:hypothetical protein